MHLTKTDIAQLGKIKRLNIINSITGIKPANLIGTVSRDGQTNLAIFSSVVHLGSNPPLLGLILRPVGEVRRHTYENLLDNGYYTINYVHPDFIEQAHYTSAKFEKAESEFAACGFTEEFLAGFTAPFVKESQVKIGLKYLQSIPIEANNTQLIIGQIEHVFVPDAVVDAKGHIDLEGAHAVGISGLNSYYQLKKIGQFPYARKQELPSFPPTKSTDEKE